MSEQLKDDAVPVNTEVSAKSVTAGDVTPQAVNEETANRDGDAEETLPVQAEKAASLATDNHTQVEDDAVDTTAKSRQNSVSVSAEETKENEEQQEDDEEKENDNGNDETDEGRKRKSSVTSSESPETKKQRVEEASAAATAEDAKELFTVAADE